MDKKTYRTGIEAAYRRSALRVLPAYRTMCTDAAVVIAGITPLKLVVNVDRRKHNTSKGIDPSNSVQKVHNAMNK